MQNTIGAVQVTRSQSGLECHERPDLDHPYPALTCELPGRETLAQKAVERNTTRQ